MVEFDASYDLRQNDWVLCLRNDGLVVQNGKDLLRGGQGGLQGGELLRQLLDGIKEGLDVLCEDKQGTDGDHILKDIFASHSQHHHQGKDAQHIDQGTKDRKDKHFPIEGTKKLCAFALEFLVLTLFSSEDPDDAHAGEILGEEGVQVGEPASGDTIGGPGDLAKNDGDEGDRRQQKERNQCQPCVHQQHHCPQTDDLDDISKEPDQNAGVHFIQRLHIIGHPGDQLSHGSQVEIATAQRLKVPIQLQSNGEDDALTGFLQQPGLCDIQDKA